MVTLDTLDRLKSFALWASRIGAGARHRGEAATLAVAEELDAVDALHRVGVPRVR